MKLVITVSFIAAFFCGKTGGQRISLKCPIYIFMFCPLLFKLIFKWQTLINKKWTLQLKEILIILWPNVLYIQFFWKCEKETHSN